MQEEQKNEDFSPLHRRWTFIAHGGGLRDRWNWFGQGFEEPGLAGVSVRMITVTGICTQSGLTTE